MILRTLLCILISLTICSCASVAVNSAGGINGGSAKAGDRGKAAAFDIVTLPIQAVVLPVALISHSLDESERKENKIIQQEHFKAVLAEATRIKNNPQIIINQDYLTKDVSSIEYQSFNYFMGKMSTSIEFTPNIYNYFYTKTNINNHKHTYIWFIRNGYIPTNMLVSIYNETFKSEHPDHSYSSLLQNRRLPLNLVEKALKHPSKKVQRTAEIVLSVRKPVVYK